MSKFTTTSLVLAILVLIGLTTLGSAAFADDDPEARKVKILANLKLRFPELEKVDVTMGDLKPSPYTGLDEGSFTHSRGVQRFLVSTDDTQLFLVGQPIDVSRTTEEIQAELATREALANATAADRSRQLNETITHQLILGNPDAPITIVEFSDFQCPYCARGAETVKQILAKYPNDVKFVFKHFPLHFHPWAKPASIAAHCAGLQNAEAFWMLHDKYFEEQKTFSVKNVVEKSKGYLANSQIDMASWSTCAADTNSEAYKTAAAVVEADMELGKKLGVTGTPGFFVNGHFLNGAQPLRAFDALISKEKNKS